MALLKARAAFVAAAAKKGGYLRTVQVGDLVDETDPVVKGRESYFEPVAATSSPVPVTEQATAAPGERRAVSTPRAASPKGRVSTKRRAAVERPAAPESPES